MEFGLTPETGVHIYCSCDSTQLKSIENHILLFTYQRNWVAYCQVPVEFS